jgi:hypothetical protein
MSARPPHSHAWLNFRYLSEEKFVALSTAEKLEYLRTAMEAMVAVAQLEARDLHEAAPGREQHAPR